MDQIYPIEISRIITFLKPQANSGPDSLTSKFLKYLTPSISVPISILINKSFQTETLSRN
ncbi:hypothetical protein LSH36_273g02010 [Paralvinella palmiformis]|uniref:Uncharacterized protein n=1 Tax=Paralvinella palmiformis TaxID=53620 RepID=A0AAD9JJL1_9ANNE|nr:hypothetical protein LSH36_273g02010 [Paralvinella palmiformis]